MSKRQLIIILIVSLAFNLAVLGMFSYVAIFHRPPFMPPQFGRGAAECQEGSPPPIIHNKMAERLELNREKLKPYHEKFTSEKRNFLDTVGKEDFSEAEANQALEKSLIAHRELENALGKNLIEMRKKMTPDEAKQFIENVRKRQKLGSHANERGKGRFRQKQQRFNPQSDE